MFRRDVKQFPAAKDVELRHQRSADCTLDVVCTTAAGRREIPAHVYKAMEALGLPEWRRLGQPVVSLEIWSEPWSAGRGLRVDRRRVKKNRTRAARISARRPAARVERADAGATRHTARKQMADSHPASSRAVARARRRLATSRSRSSLPSTARRQRRRRRARRYEAGLSREANGELAAAAAAAAPMPCDPRRPPGGGGGLSALRFGVRALFRDGDAGAIVFFSPRAAASPSVRPVGVVVPRRSQEPDVDRLRVSERAVLRDSVAVFVHHRVFPVCASNASTTP